MTHHRDKTRQTCNAQHYRYAAVDGLSVCAIQADNDDHPTECPEWQQNYHSNRENPPQSLGAEFLEHQLGLCVNVMMVVLLTYYLFPDLKDKTGGFFMPSYPRGSLYDIGPQDLKLVIGFIVFFTATRDVILNSILKNLAARLGIMKPRNQVQFAEQSYMIIHYTTYWSWGLGLFMRNTSTEVGGFENLLISLWSGFPLLYMDASLKIYYLSQIAFWLQQVAMLHLEHRRKDHLQMLLHHIVTTVLLVGSYSYRQWRAGNAILVCMDLVDIILPLAKVLHYLSLQRSRDIVFAVFVAAWIITRHIIFLAICWSICKHVHGTTMAYGTYSTNTGAMISPENNNDILINIFQPFLDPSSGIVTFNANIRWLFLGLLLLLHCITVAWFFMIFRVIMRVLRGEGATDTRSEDEHNCQ
ncbi:longevity assurance proteins LAG1/LAC1 [Polychaeton citri CBS 116435]|uniref:Longevity assurance proteins LAG1/LAC1 n=1 Tax=Polychaeton citri CBS 116435 TaxID=1314669 RepID=A0A9P4UKN9_9PEZI|nr:longevity assurance proteins LAG1/LAC1 [Polychaeton citri CBS 116435]